MPLPERNSPQIGKTVLWLDEVNCDEEKLLEPRGLDKPVEGSVVDEPERRGLLSSANTDDAAGAATEAEWCSVVCIGAGGVALDLGKRCRCSLNNSVDIRVLGLVVLEAVYC